VAQGFALLRTSIKYRLLLGYAAVMLALLILMGALLIWGLNRSFNQQIEAALNSVVLDVMHDMQRIDVNQTHRIDPDEVYAISPVFIEVYAFKDKEPIRILSSENVQSHTLRAYWHHNRGLYFQNISFISNDDESAMMQVPFTFDGRPFAVVVATPLAEADDFLEQFIALYLLLGTLFFMLALIAGNSLIQKVLQPMQAIARTAKKMVTFDVKERVTLGHVKDEFYDLAEAFNAMLQRLQEQYERMKRFNTNVSHELKTPLTIMRGEAEVTLRQTRSAKEYTEVLHSVIDECSTMQQITQSMLLLAKEPVALALNELEDVELEPLLSRLFKQFQPMAIANGITLTLEVQTAPIVKAESTLIRQLFYNIIDNAIKYTPSGKTVAIRLRTNASEVIVIVEDEGIGIAKAQQAKLFEPFWREDSAHSKAVPGHGLGLSIVQWIMQVHGMSYDLSSKPGDGTQWTFTFKT